VKREPSAPVVVVGAGLAGLACARALYQSGIAVQVFEAADSVGGRVRTDRVDGFLLDRGFQVLFTAYPEVQAQLDLAALGLKAFLPGAQVRKEGVAFDVSDPLREPSAALRGALAPVGSLIDKLRVLALRHDVCRGELDELWRRPHTTTLVRLRAAGFSERMIDLFFRPFLGGIFLERDLKTSSRLFDFYFRMLSVGDTALPREGMGALARQLAAHVPSDLVTLRAPVSRVAVDNVVLQDGTVVKASAVVVATDGTAASRLLDGEVVDVPWRGVTTLSYAVLRSPLPPRRLVLNAGNGLLSTLCAPSDVQPSYAPAGQALVSATTLGIPDVDDDELDRVVRAELRAWYGAPVDRWRLLRVHRIPCAQPAQPPELVEVPERPVRLASGLFVTGDHRDHASLHGALRSGRRAAAAVLDAFGVRAPVHGSTSDDQHGRTTLLARTTSPSP
jgi:phytoene dehydrogenase-like protein